MVGRRGIRSSSWGMVLGALGALVVAPLTALSLSAAPAGAVSVPPPSQLCQAFDTLASSVPPQGAPLLLGIDDVARVLGCDGGLTIPGLGLPGQSQICGAFAQLQSGAVAAGAPAPFTAAVAQLSGAFDCSSPSGSSGNLPPPPSQLCQAFATVAAQVPSQAAAFGAGIVALGSALGCAPGSGSGGGGGSGLPGPPGTVCQAFGQLQSGAAGVSSALASGVGQLSGAFGCAPSGGGGGSGLPSPPGAPSQLCAGFEQVVAAVPAPLVPVGTGLKGVASAFGCSPSSGGSGSGGSGGTPAPPGAPSQLCSALAQLQAQAASMSAQLAGGVGQLTSAFGCTPAGGGSGSGGGTGPSTSPSQSCSAPAVPNGYWMDAADGGIFAFGNLPYCGSMGGTTLRAPVVGMAPTAGRGGYWMDAADGGIFAFGDAGYYGSMGGSTLNKPVVGMAATPDGKGYWLVASDGGIFAFGDAAFHGSMGGTPLNKPIVGMAA